ncbi:MAG: Hint domain-containing protein [Candidatus Saccharibacteria bacterium]|nr:Hint domain-containing protein [Pseudorhodobacter sp.]
MAQATSSTTVLTPALAPLMAVIAGTPVMTLEGELPVEFLQPGDRILTRAGVRRLVQVAVSVVRNARVVKIAHGTLGVDCPTEDVTVSAGQQILVRDWRARAMFGQPQAMIAASRLADGEYIRAETLPEARFFSLSFQDDAVIYAGGLELSCPALVTA